MSVFIPSAALFLAAILCMSAAHKLVERPRLASATAGLLRLHAEVAMPVTMAAAAIEIAAALALIFPTSRPIGAVLAALLWSFYGVALFAARRRGDNAIDCGCDFGKQRRGIGSFAIGRAFALAAVALVLSAGPAGAGEVDIHSTLAALALLALLFAADEISHLSALGRGVTR